MKYTHKFYEVLEVSLFSSFSQKHTGQLFHIALAILLLKRGGLIFAWKHFKSMSYSLTVPSVCLISWLWSSSIHKIAYYFRPFNIRWTKKTHWMIQQYEETLIFHPHFHLKAFWICRHFQSILNIIKVIKMENFSLTLKHQKLRQNLFSCITYSLKSKAGICGLPSYFHCIYFVLDRQAFDG